MTDLLATLQDYPPSSIWTLAPKALIMQGAGLIATGDIAALRWSGEQQLDFEFPQRLSTLVHRLRLNGDRIEGKCDTHHTQPCAHHLASLMLAMHLLKDFAGFGRFPNRVLAERLKAALLRLDERAVTEAQAARSEQRHVLIRPTGPQLFAFRDSMSNQARDAFATLPLEIRSFAGLWSAAVDREAAFWKWFNDPVRRFGVFLELNSRVLAVERPHASGWEGELALHLDDSGITMRRALLQHGQPVPETHVSVGNSMIFLTESRQLVRMTGTSAWSAANHLLAALRQQTPTQQQLTLDSTVPHALWNAAHIPWDTHSTRQLEWHGQNISEPPLAAARAHIELRALPDEKALAVNITVRANDVVLPAHSLALTIEREFELAHWSHSNLLFAKSRRDTIVAACLQCLINEDARQRRAILHELSLHDAFRTPAQGRQAADTILQLITNRGPDTAPEPPLLCASRSQGWLQIAGIQRLADLACANARLLLIAEPASASLNADLCVPIDEAMPRLPALLEACALNGIELAFDDQPLRATALECSVSAAKVEHIDFFELKPEVRCGGQLIPQDQWESLVLKGHFMDDAGALHILDTGSLRGLTRLSDVLKQQRREADDRSGKKARDASAALRIPRVRILDWLMLNKDGVQCALPAAERAVLESLIAFETLERVPLPSNVRATLRDYQHAGYSWLAFLYQHGFGACLADDMGLGKTLQTITLLAAIKEGIVKPLAGDHLERRPHLLVVPPTLLFNWQNEVRIFCPGLYVHEYTGKGRSLIGIHEGIVLTTYELARRDIAKLSAAKFDCIIFDEAQAVKNIDGERAKAMRQLNGRFKLALTGTPLENHVGEYYSIIDLALPGLFGDYQTFMQAQKNTELEFKPIHRARPFVLRRTKERILKELPPKVESDLHLDLTEEQKRFYTRAVADVRAEVLAAFKDKTAQQAGIVALTALTRLRQICVSPALIDPAHKETSPKISYLIDKLQELQAEGHAALVFSQFTKSLDLLDQHLAEAKINRLRLDGSTPQQKRKTLVECFQSGKGPGVFLISLKAGGAGLNLTRASYVFHLDPWWNPAAENQASDRAHRMGQQQTVFIQRLLMRHTIEEKIMLLKQQKRAVFDEVLGGIESDRATKGSIITREDLRFLLD